MKTMISYLSTDDNEGNDDKMNVLHSYEVHYSSSEGANSYAGAASSTSSANSVYVKIVGITGIFFRVRNIVVGS